MLQTFSVVIPEGVYAGNQFTASLGGQLAAVIVPRGSFPNDTLHVQIPVNSYSNARSPWRSTNINTIENITHQSLNNVPSITWPNPINIPDTLDTLDTPMNFICPITECIMRQPTTTPSGISYDYDAIVEWLNTKQIDPTTNLPLETNQLYPNRNLYNIINEYVLKSTT